jgi:chromosomal replication initiation ATPase DnaA
MYQRCPHMSLTRIGQLLNRDHTTVLHAFQSVPQFVIDDPFVKAWLLECERRLNAGRPKGSRNR